MIPFIVLGLIEGVVYGLLATGLVLVYKGARVFNFAAAEFGTAAGFLLYGMTEKIHLPYALAAILAVLAVTIFGYGMERFIVRPLFDAPRVTLLVATTGVALALITVELLIFGANAANLGPAIKGVGVSIFGTFVTPQQLLTFVVLVCLGVGMYYFFNKADLGLAVIATSQEPVATDLVGIGTKRMSSFIWTFAAALGAISGVLVIADRAITPGYMTTTYLLGAFTAAVVGGISSLPGAFVGGVVIGLVRNVIGGYFLGNIHLPGLENLLVFGALMLVLLVRPQGILGDPV
ncbi:MAG: branched-chain amino acid ABC transporter permease [Actinomycetota bacterium]